MRALLLTFLLTSAVFARGLWDMAKNLSSDGNIKTKQYTLEVSGTNTRGYVFEVPEMRSICFITYSSIGIPAIACKTYREIGN